MKIILRQITVLLALLSMPFLMWGQCDCPATPGDCVAPTCCYASGAVGSTVNDCLANGASVIRVGYNGTVSNGVDASGAQFCLVSGVNFRLANNSIVDNQTCIQAGGASSVVVSGVAFNGTGPVNDLNDAFAMIPEGTTATAAEVILGLPVELVSFTAKSSDQGSVLEWITATETDNDHFLLEHSTDAKTFEYMATIPAKPNGSQQQQYQFLDKAPKSGINYYRLWQYDVDGTKSNLGLVDVNNHKLTGGSVIVTPNPVVVGGRITLNASDLFAEPNVSFTLVNSVGQTWSLAPENGELLIPSQLSNGLYYLIITQSSERELLPLVLIE